MSRLTEIIVAIEAEGVGQVLSALKQVDGAQAQVVSSTKAAGTQQVTSNKNAGLSWSSLATGVNQSMQIINQVVGAVAQAYAATIGDWTDYADSMRLSAQMAGVTVEEMSKLSQAADDFRVPIGTMQKSMEMALKNGFVPTIDNLANLSDKLLAIKDPAERAAEASKIFGKSYADMMPFLLAGGNAIRGATEAVSANLIVTKAAAAEAKAYKDQVDALGDTWTGFKNVIGKTAVPALTAQTKSLTTLMSGGKNFIDSTVDITGSYENYAKSVAAVNAEISVERDKMEQIDIVTSWFIKDIKVMTQEEYNAVAATKQATSSAYDYMIAQYDVGEAVSIAAEELEAAEKQSAAFMASFADITSLTSGFGTITSLANSYDDILAEITVQEKIMAEEPTGSEKWLVANGRVIELKGSMTDLANQMVLDMFAATIAIGTVTETEMAAYLDMAVRMGLTSRTGADAAMAEWLRASGFITGLPMDPKTGNIFINDAEYLAWVRRWQDYQPESKTAIITIERIEAGLPVYGPYPPGPSTGLTPLGGDFAIGGPVYPGQTYNWQEPGREGEMLLTEKYGRVLSNHEVAQVIRESLRPEDGGSSRGSQKAAEVQKIVNVTVNASVSSDYDLDKLTREIVRRINA